MVHLSDIHSVTDFQRNTKDHLKRLEKSRRPLVLTLNGKAKAVLASGGTPTGVFTGHVSNRAPKAKVSDDGHTVVTGQD